MDPFAGGFEVFGMLLIVLAVAALWSTVKIVPQGCNYTVENFGRYTRTLQPGPAHPHPGDGARRHQA